MIPRRARAWVSVTVFARCMISVMLLIYCHAQDLQHGLIHQDEERPTTMLIGIFGKERQRFRDTILSANEENGTPLCSWSTYANEGRLGAKRCQVMYIFVEPLVPTSTSATNGDKDVVQLQVQQESNTILAWFQYAPSMVFDKKVDYYAQMDGDRIFLVMPLLFDFLNKLPPSPRSRQQTIVASQHNNEEPDYRRMYGGLVRDYSYCHKKDKCEYMRRKLWMAEFIFLSSDLVEGDYMQKAASVIDWGAPYRADREDMQFGSLVILHESPMNFMPVNGGAFWRVAEKAGEWRDLDRKYRADPNSFQPDATRWGPNNLQRGEAPRKKEK